MSSSTIGIDGRAAARPARDGSRRTRSTAAGSIFLAVLVLYFLVPIWWLFVASTKNAGDLFGGGSALWFGNSFSLFDNIGRLFSFGDGVYARWLLNSAIYAVVGGLGGFLERLGCLDKRLQQLRLAFARRRHSPLRPVVGLLQAALQVRNFVA